jgi:hypothetical protein
MSNYHDSMALVSEFVCALRYGSQFRKGVPDMFFTMTCNPAWKEILDELLPGQTANDRPDLVARVFALKLASFIEWATKSMVFGVVTAHTYVIEFQKRGLPHAHILVWLREDCKVRTIEDVDNLVCAEIPDPEVSARRWTPRYLQTSPELHRIIAQCMAHGPCGPEYPEADSPCMKEGVCTKKYPREFTDTTSLGRNGYALYRRRDNGRVMKVKRKGKEYRVDNRFVSYICTST